MVEMENVSAGYGKCKVLHNINLKLLKGQVTTLVGVNGKRCLVFFHCPMARFGLTEFRWKIFRG